jgi:mRNA interferase RelE/StbE
MPKYSISLSRTAEKQLDKLPGHVAEPIIQTIANLSNNPRPRGSKKLKGRNGYRIRKGDYRIIYDIFDKHLLIEVIEVGHRRDIYD